MNQNPSSSACSHGSCQARVKHAPRQYQAYVLTHARHSELSRNVPQLLTPFSHKKDPKLDSENTPSRSDTPSIRSYLLSPLKTSRVTGVSRLVLPGQSLLLWEIIVNIMDNSTNKLAALSTTGRLCQEVRQVVISLNVGDKRFAHCNRFSDCVVAN